MGGGTRDGRLAAAAVANKAAATAAAVGWAASLFAVTHALNDPDAYLPGLLARPGPGGTLAAAVSSYAASLRVQVDLMGLRCPDAIRVCC